MLILDIVLQISLRSRRRDVLQLHGRILFHRLKFPRTVNFNLENKKNSTGSYQVNRVLAAWYFLILNKLFDTIQAPCQGVLKNTKSKNCAPVFESFCDINHDWNCSKRRNNFLCWLSGPMHYALSIKKFTETFWTTCSTESSIWIIILDYKDGEKV